MECLLARNHSNPDLRKLMPYFGTHFAAVAVCKEDDVFPGCASLAVISLGRRLFRAVLLNRRKNLHVELEVLKRNQRISRPWRATWGLRGSCPVGWGGVGERRVRGASVRGYSGWAGRRLAE